jgi:hypothetical protein
VWACSGCVVCTGATGGTVWACSGCVVCTGAAGATAGAGSGGAIRTDIGGATECARSATEIWTATRATSWAGFGAGGTTAGRLAAERARFRSSVGSYMGLLMPKSGLWVRSGPLSNNFLLSTGATYGSGRVDGSGSSHHALVDEDDDDDETKRQSTAKHDDRRSSTCSPPEGTPRPRGFAVSALVRKRRHCRCPAPETRWPVRVGRRISWRPFAAAAGETRTPVGVAAARTEHPRRHRMNRNWHVVVSAAGTRLTVEYLMSSAGSQHQERCLCTEATMCLYTTCCLQQTAASHAAAIARHHQYEVVEYVVALVSSRAVHRSRHQSHIARDVSPGGIDPVDRRLAHAVRPCRR